MEKIKNYIEFKKLFKNITEKFVRDLDITLIEAAEYSIIEFEIYLSESPEDSTFIFTAWAIYLLENNCLNERGKDNFFIAEMKKCYQQTNLDRIKSIYSSSDYHIFAKDVNKIQQTFKLNLANIMQQE
ncbi:hypothetical protein [Neisseria meningitidis]|uniref:hypothetical protein n=1 Tax=Neisseria meningitidis TaxID=487 RepID=UPI000766916A|nr:hypothetical protein [Neisseria meningitidis]CWQ15874.1 Uncharacterised protein [Neisseria meningitidis]CWT93935.1 Uncharacterised protein [Neisseria meningitidis]